MIQPVTPAPRSEADCLLRSILERPDDDAPRLVFADWLDEHGQENYGEFIRVQVELARLDPARCLKGGLNPGHPRDCRPCFLRRRERELWAAHGRDWFVDEPIGLSAALEDFRGLIGSLLGVVRRGFVASVSLPTAIFIGGMCERCSNGTGAFVPNPECPACHGSGRVAGVAASLFARHPVEAVRLVDREPQTFPEDHPVWFADEPLDEGGEDYDGEWLPWSIARLLRQGKPKPVERYDNRLRHEWSYWSDAAAHADLSAACVSYGRALTDLPPLAVADAPGEPPHPARVRGVP